MKGTIAVYIYNSNHSNLPAYPDFQEYQGFVWGSVDGTTFTNKINAAYDEVIHWVFRAYAESSSMEIIALMAAMTLPILLLQKPHHTSKVEVHIKCIELRLSL